MTARQLSFLPRLRPEYGGALMRGRRKTARPVATRRQAMHIVLRSSRARGEWSMLHRRHREPVETLTRKIAMRHGIRLCRFANVGNHLHLLVNAPTRTAFQRFLRELAGTVAIAVTGARNGQPLGGRFWDALAYTRIVSYGRDFRNLEQYFIKNLFEAAGLLGRRARALGLRVIPNVGWARAP